jgi:putative hydrolase of the HAD superfamily
MRAFLFDLDDTLFDHAHSTRVALGVIQRQLAPLRALALDALEAAHAVVLEEVHRQVLAGALDVDAARIVRFRSLVESYGGGATDAEIEAGARAYRAAYLEARRPTAGAAALLRALRPHGRIGVVSNNVMNEQAAKMIVCGLREHVDALVVSEEVGIAKPDPRIFRVALDRLGAPADDAVMIGDSWSADVAGALAAGIRPVWFNPLRRPCPDPSCIAGELESWEPAETIVAKILACWRV